MIDGFIKTNNFEIYSAPTDLLETSFIIQMFRADSQITISVPFEKNIYRVYIYPNNTQPASDSVMLQLIEELGEIIRTPTD